MMTEPQKRDVAIVIDSNVANCSAVFGEETIVQHVHALMFGRNSTRYIMLDRSDTAGWEMMWGQFGYDLKMIWGRLGRIGGNCYIVHRLAKNGEVERHSHRQKRCKLLSRVRRGDHSSEHRP